ncbi:hypothetical protein [Sphingomonas sp. ZT3P38]|uniref:hypothetical protein n=1 Tax=Parasphingomonas zepuensis TaxID=3096161 RepID=UPI003FA7CDFD
MIPVPKLAFALALAAAPNAAPAQQIPPNPADLVVNSPPYPYYADLVLASPMIVDATIRSSTKLKGPDAAGVAPGNARLYVEADVLALIRGTAALPPRIAYVLDVPVDSRGRLPKLRKLRVILFARPVPGNAALIQLVRPDAQRDWTPAADALTRRITQETLSPDAPPQVTGIGNAFHVGGDLPGSGETQIFLSTADGRPVSLGIKRLQGERPRWSVALSELVGDSALPPARDTLLWYRLACGLPPALPDSSLESLGEADAAIAREDYRLVLRSLGPCDRSAR